jgi:hypothetical protein
MKQKDPLSVLLKHAASKNAMPSAVQFPPETIRIIRATGLATSNALKKSKRNSNKIVA